MSADGNGHGDCPAAAVRVRGLERSFGRGEARVRAVRGVDLRIEPGALAMVVGPSGCGKTTLLSLIAGVLEPDDGEVEVFGARWHELSGAEQTRQRGELIGFVFQSFNIIPMLTTLQNAMVPALIKGESHSSAAAKARQKLEAVGLGDRTGSRPQQLSGGMLQRVSIARALVAEPSLLICDEPTANLDAETGSMIMDLVTELCGDEDPRGRARTGIAVTHDTRIFSYASEIHEMEDGRLVGRREPEETAGEGGA